MKEEIKKLELRIEELENQLKGVGTQMAEIDPEKMKVFKEVSLQLGYDPDSVGGINECKVCTVCSTPIACRVCKVCRACSVCRVCRVCIACDVECSCGPCNVGSFESGGLGRFEKLGY